MQPGFAKFPAGWPAVGLLLLRLALGAGLILAGVAALIGGSRAGPAAWIWITGCAAIASGAALLVGFLTSVAGAAAVLSIGGMLICCSPSVAPLFSQTAVVVALMAVVALALAFLGPGAISIDSRLFGRREITLPGARNTSTDQ